MSKVPWLGLLCMGLTGCGVLDAVFLPAEDGGTSVAESAGGILGSIPVIGTTLVTVLGFGRWGYVEYRHHQLIAAGKKDDNRDGVEDKA